MFEWLGDASLAAIRDYGWLALFVFVVLETAWIVHFAPSEVVIPAAALVFVTGPVSLVAFVVVLTVAAVVGSLLCYWLFGVNADRVLSRFDRYLPTSEIDRGREWFQRHGRGVVFWGRLVPVVRTPLSIPAGAARMDLRRFVWYSGAGWLAYWIPLSLLGYGGETGRAPLELALGVVSRFSGSNPVVAGVVGVTLVVAGVAAVLTRRDRTASTSPGSK